MLFLALIEGVQDIPPGWAVVDAAIITVVGGGLAAMLGWVLRRLRHVQTDAAAAKQSAQVTEWHTANAHLDPTTGLPINQRDDMDAKHEAEMAALQALALDVSGMKKDIGGIRQELRTLHDNDSHHEREHGRMRDHIDRLEQTIPKDAVRELAEQPHDEPDE